MVNFGHQMFWQTAIYCNGFFLSEAWSFRIRSVLSVLWDVSGLRLAVSISSATALADKVNVRIQAEGDLMAAGTPEYLGVFDALP